MTNNVIPFIQKGREMSAAVQLNQEVQTKSVYNPPQPYFPTDSDWNMMLRWGAAAIKSGMLPAAIKTPEAAAIIALKGRELRIPFMVAIAHIHIINGKPSMSAELMQAQAMKNIPGLVINVLKMERDGSTVEILRPGQKAFQFSFTMEDAKCADVLNKAVWKQYPKAMFFARAITAALRAKCADALNGVSYTPEELGANVDGDGNVIETTGRQVEAPIAPPSIEGLIESLKPQSGGDEELPPIPPMTEIQTKEWVEAQSEPEQEKFHCGKKMMRSLYPAWHRDKQVVPLYCHTCKKKDFSEFESNDGEFSAGDPPEYCRKS